jgi:hypothetical protein
MYCLHFFFLAWMRLSIFFFQVNFEHKIHLSCIFIFLIAFAFKFFDSLFVTFQFNFINLKIIVDCNKMHGRFWSNLVSDIHNDIHQTFTPIVLFHSSPKFSRPYDRPSGAYLIVVTLKKIEYLTLKKRGLQPLDFQNF